MINVPEELEGLEPDVSLEPGIEPAAPVEPAEPKLYAGKYKTAEEMEAAYLESQSAMTKAQQEAAEYRKMVEGNPPVDQYATQQPYQQQPAPVDFASQFNDQVFENPYQAIGGLVANTVQQLVQTQKTAQANVKREVAKLRTNPQAAEILSKVSDELEYALANVPDEQLANPQAASQIVQFAFQAAVGQHFINQGQTPAPTPVPAPVANPGQRVAGLQQMGVGSPTTSEEPGGADIDAKGRGALDALGIGRQEQANIAQKAQARINGEELY
jgi:hypothetical protein